MFDRIEAVHAKVAQASPDRPSLRRLAEVLEDRKLWPEGFVWDYRQANSCAIGLADRLWEGGSSDIRHMPGVSANLFASIFYRVEHWRFWTQSYDRRMSAVTPKDVARQIRKVLASHPDVS